MHNLELISPRGNRLFNLSEAQLAKAEEKIFSTPCSAAMPFITAEDYSKWYTLFEVDPATLIVRELHFHEMSSPEFEKRNSDAGYTLPLVGDHCINPQAVIDYAAHTGQLVSEDAMFAIEEMWRICYLEN